MKQLSGFSSLSGTGLQPPRANDQSAGGHHRGSIRRQSLTRSTKGVLWFHWRGRHMKASNRSIRWSLRGRAFQNLEPGAINYPRADAVVCHSLMIRRETVVVPPFPQRIQGFIHTLYEVSRAGVHGSELGVAAGRCLEIWGPTRERIRRGELSLEV